MERCGPGCGPSPDGRQAADSAARRLAGAARLSGPDPARAHRERIPPLWYWLGPVPAIAVWTWILYYGPWGDDIRDISGYAGLDPAAIAVSMVLTFLTAGVLEEVLHGIVTALPVVPLLR
ncbi:hypothetical protein BJY16_008788 [Actinoplanes octamycinicus]|uniref:CAAX prenyl protease-like protein n=1 Tax=Actinoplanes octamycinicus TaxID=135948 RepID=A0A7W7H7F1_9ACTN|nr:hypothetical protein [Actinoplanes octamycinicus]MBB4745329.1 hypothetical protein [Actinoplanes octamycinicus]GIE62191.1 hypothetical protein Aoc01nite_75930 [Actinoplanes octamycinicus]